MKNLTLLIIAVFSLNMTIKAQSALELLKAIQSSMEETESYSLDIKYEFLDRKTGVLDDSFNGSFIKQDNNYYSKIGEMINVVIDDQKLSIDNTNQYLFYEKGTFTLSASNYNPEKVLEFAESVSMVELENGKVEIHLLFPENRVLEFSKMIFTIDKKINFLTSLAVHFKESPNVEIKNPLLKVTYENVNFSPEIDEDLFSSSNYFLIQEEKITGQNLYENYRIINQTL